MPQQFFPGQEPPGHDPEIETAIATKYERLAAAKLAREAVHVSDAKLLELVEARGAPYQFTEPGTGKRKTLKLAAAKKLKTLAAKSAKKEQADREWEAAQQEHRGGEQQDAAKAAWEAEVKRRRGGDSDPAPADPFASIRAAMDTDDANVVDQRPHDETPAQRSAREAEEARATRRGKRASR